MKKIKKIYILLSFFLITIFQLYPNDRDENIDLFLVLDKSLSMSEGEAIEPVKEYVNEYIIDNLLIPGDRIVVITFYGKAELFIVEDLREEADKRSLKERISTIKADGRFTDIGNALDKLKNVIEEYEREDMKKYVLLITDGKQEAPPDSKYYSPDGSFNHAFLENTKTIQKKGWKIQILGIGIETAAKELARELTGEYSQVNEAPTKEEIAEKVKDILGRIEQTSQPIITPLNSRGEGKLSLTVKSEGFTNYKTVSIESIRLNWGDGFDEVIAENFIFKISPNEEKTLEIPIRIDERVEAGKYEGTLEFSFKGDTVLIPAVSSVKFRVKGFLENNYWLIGAVALLMGLIIFSAVKLLQGKPSRIRFRVLLENMPVQKDPFVLSVGESLLLFQKGGEFFFSMEESEGIVARIDAEEKGLSLQVLDEKSFPVMEKIPDNILGEKLRVKSKAGGYVTFTFKAA